jgi:hypothetical protein
LSEYVLRRGVLVSTEFVIEEQERRIENLEGVVYKLLPLVEDMLVEDATERLYGPDTADVGCAISKFPLFSGTFPPVKL